MYFYFQAAKEVKSGGDVAVKVVQQLCPSVGVSYLSAALSNTQNKNPNLVLIVTFTEKRYQNLPIFEALYRHHFKNILYCGIHLIHFCRFFIEIVKSFILISYENGIFIRRSY